MNQIKYDINQNYFSKISGFPFCYWMKSKTFDVFNNPSIESVASCCKGLDTCDNDTFVRGWYEVEYHNIGFNISDTSNTFSYKWFPYCKGGDYRKWYGNFEKVVLWQNDGEILRNLRDSNGKIKSRPQNIRYYFKPGLTFNSISSSYRAIRYMNNCIFGGGGSGLFSNNEDMIYHLCCFINSKVSKTMFDYLNPGLNFLVGDLLRIPYCESENDEENIIKFSNSNIEISRLDWDSFETSWDFKKHPLI